MSKIFILHRDGKPGLMLSDSVGIEKMKPLIDSFIEDFSDVNKLIQISFSRESLLLKDEMDAYARNNIRFTSFYESNREGFYEKLNGELKKLMFQTGRLPNIYVAGREEFKQEISSALEQAGVHMDNIIIEGGAPELSCNGACSSCSSAC